MIVYEAVDGMLLLYVVTVTATTHHHRHYRPISTITQWPS